MIDASFGLAPLKVEGARVALDPAYVASPQNEVAFVGDTPVKRLALAMWEVMGINIGYHWHPEDFVSHIEALVERGLVVPDDMMLTGKQSDTGA